MANYTIGELVWKVTGDKSGLDRTLRSGEKQVNKTAQTFKRAAKVVGGALIAIGIKKFGSYLVQAASDAEETANKFGVVFSKVITDANAAAKNLADNYGLSRTASKQLLSDTGDLLTGFGLTQEKALELADTTAQLGTDLASFTNYAGGAEGATQALTKAMLGEREQVKMLGIALTETELEKFAAQQGKAWKEMSKGEKAAITLELAMKQSKNAIGDFARSANSFANVSRRVDARLQDIAVDAGANLTPALANLGIAFLETSKDGGVITQALNGITEAVAWAINGIAKLLLVFQRWDSQWHSSTIEKVLKDVNEQISKQEAYLKQVESQIGKVNAQYNKTYADTLKNLEENKKKREKILKDQDAEIKKQEDLTKLSDELFNRTKDQEDAIKKAALQRQKEKEETSQVKDELSGIDALLRDMQSAGYWDNYSDQIKRSEKSAEGLNKTLEELTAIERLEAFNSALSGLAGNLNGLFSALQSYNDAILQNQLDRLDAQMQAELEAAGVATETAVEAAQAQLEAAQAAGDAEAIADAEKALKKAQIEEKYQKKKAKLEYQASLRAWEFQRALAAIQLIMAPLQAYVSGLAAPWPLTIPMAVAQAALAGAAAAVSYAAVLEAKPSPPAFATGGIVPGSRSTSDNTLVRTTPGEMILNDGQQANLFNMLDQGGRGGGTFYRVSPIDEKLTWAELYQAMKRGDLYVYSGAIVDR